MAHQAKPIICLNDNVVHESVASAARFYKLNSHTSITNVLSGRAKTVSDKKLRFAYHTK